MGFQFSACPAQYDHYIIFGKTISLCDVRHRLDKEVPAHQHIPFPLRQRPNKTLNGFSQFFDLVCGPCVCATAKTFSKLVQNEGDLTAAPFLRILRIETVEGKVTGNLRQK